MPLSRVGSVRDASVVAPGRSSGHRQLAGRRGRRGPLNRDAGVGAVAADRDRRRFAAVRMNSGRR
eukprot:2677095-Pleurochrysis_carterae.AAC.1